MTDAPINGWISVKKPLRMSSADIVRKLKRHLNVKKIGHAGTLDPLAVGVLPMAIGEATKVMHYCMHKDKSYRFVVCFGHERITDDLEGEISNSSNKLPTKESLLEVLPLFQGEINQVPPIYSALKVGGVRAYKLARMKRQVSLSGRDVTIKRLELVSFFHERFAEFYVECSAGTYVRSLARDIARALGTFGHVFALQRVCSQPFLLEEAVDFVELMKDNSSEIIKKSLHPVHYVLSHFSRLTVDDNQVKMLKNGQKIYFDKNILKNNAKNEDFENKMMYAMHQDKLIALLRAEDAYAKPVRTFHL